MYGEVQVVTYKDDSTPYPAITVRGDLTIINNLAFIISEKNDAGFRLDVGSFVVVDDMFLISGSFGGKICQWQFKPGTVMKKVDGNGGNGKPTLGLVE